MKTKDIKSFYPYGILAPFRNWKEYEKYHSYYFTFHTNEKT